MGKKLREHYWIWGHPTNAMYEFLNKGDGIDRGVSTVSPVDGLSYIGATNLFYNDYIKAFDVMLECERAKDVPNVGWVIERTSLPDKKHTTDVVRLVELKKTYNNICIGIFDDFFSPANVTNNYVHYTPDDLRAYRETLHESGMELWVVLYTENIDHYGMDMLRPYLNEFDGITLWFWDEKDVASGYDKYIDLFLKETPGQKRMLGCYIYNFARGLAADPALVIEQMEKGSALIKNGDIEGLIIHTNSAFDLRVPFEAVEECKKWIELHGDEEV